MSINPLFRSSPTRMMGLSSGMDTDSMIQQTMRIHQMRIDAQMRKKTVLQWRQETYNSIKDQITSFRNAFLSSQQASASTTMVQRGVYNSTVASVAGKNADAVTIRTSLDSTVGTLRIGQVVSLAKGANISGNSGVSANNAGFAMTDKIESLNLVGGKKMFAEGEDTATININGEEITLDRNDTISSMISKVNNSAAGVTMKYDRLSDQFTFEAKATGEGTISVSGSALEALGFANAGDAGGISVTNGSNAKVFINGNLEEFTSNTFNFRGLTITLNRETSAGATGTGLHEDDSLVTIKRDATEAINRIKKFIEAYNSIVKKIEGLVRERKNSSEATYGPLTDEEKSFMSEKQIDEWEAIAKKGILKNDNGLQSLAASLRGALYESVQKAGMSPAEIGLTTGNYFNENGGQIDLNEDKLRAALEEDPNRVAEIFAGTEENRGLLWRMNSIMGDYLNKSQPQTLKSLEDSIKRANEQMTKMQQRMYAEEDKLYRQFAAMETALSKMQSQGDWMTAMLGGGKK